MVMGVPESGIPAAEGFARRSGIPFGHGLVKNRYIGRTFIAPSQEMRALGVRMKLNPLRENIDGPAPGGGGRLDRAGHHHPGDGRRCCARAGAAEVHMRISSPPYRWPCFYGMDTGTRGELLAANMEVDEIRDYLDVDTLSYLTLDGLLDAVGAPGAGFCTACLTGEYPVPIPPEAGKGVLEGGIASAPEPQSLFQGTMFDGGSSELPAQRGGRRAAVVRAGHRWPRDGPASPERGGSGGG